MQNDTDTQLHLKNQLCFPLYVASRMITKTYQPYLKELDITYPQYLVLLVLWQKEACTISEIGKELYLETNTLTPLLKRLTKKGIITKKQDTIDERKIKVLLTEKGQQLKMQAQTIPSKITEAIQGTPSIDSKKATEFKQMLTGLIAILQKQ